MIGIRGLGGADGGIPSAPRKAPAGASFAVPEEARTAGPGVALASNAIKALDAMLALQEGEAPAAQDREARRHGQELLRELARLQRAMLGGGADAAMLGRLASLAEAMPKASDPELGTMIAAVVLRAKVELARQGLKA